MIHTSYVHIIPTAEIKVWNQAFKPQIMSFKRYVDWMVGETCDATQAVLWASWHDELLGFEGGRHLNHEVVSQDDWLVVYLPLWKMMDFVSWDDYSIPNCFWKVIKFHGSSHHQPDELIILLFPLLTIISHRLTIDEP